MLSKAGSNSSATSSISNGLPSDTQSSIWFLHKIKRTYTLLLCRLINKSSTYSKRLVKLPKTVKYAQKIFDVRSNEYSFNVNWDQLLPQKQYDQLFSDFSVYLKYLWLRVVTIRSLNFSMFLIHILPCVCGSISRGKRDALVTIMPFWMDKSSVGRPHKFQSPICLFKSDLFKIYV